MTVGKIVERERKLRGMTLEGVGQRVGLSKVSIHNLETGKKFTSDEYLRKIAEVLELNPPMLLQMAAIERGTLSLKQVPESIQRLLCRMAHGETPSAATAAKLSAILDHEPVAA